MGQSLAIPRVIPNDWKRLDLIVNKIKMRLGRDGSPTFTDLTLTGVLVLSKICTVAAGLNVLRVTGLQTDGVAMTGTLRGAYIDVSNGSTAATGTIRAMELKARTEAPGDIGNDVAVLEGLSISADSKAHSVTTMRAAEFILDGKTGGTIDEAVGLRIANNLQADKATISYGLQIYRDSFDYTADIQLSNGATIGTLTSSGLGLKLDADNNYLEIGYLRLGGERIIRANGPSVNQGITINAQGNDGVYFNLTDGGTGGVYFYNGTIQKLAWFGGTTRGECRVFDEDLAEWLSFSCSFGYGSLEVTGTGTPQPLLINNNAHSDVWLFQASTSGETKGLRIYGYKSGDAKRYLDITTGGTVDDTVDFTGLGNYRIAGNVGIGVQPVTQLTVEGTITLKEQATADGDTAAYGQIWIKNTSPNQAWFVNDLGTEIRIAPQDLQTSATPTFAGLTIVNAITEFSTDNTLGDISDSAIPTEKAISEYLSSTSANVSGASRVGIEDPLALYSATDVEAALEEVMDQITVVTTTANSITTVTGTLDSGNVASTQTINDADTYDVSEVTGTPGFDIQATMTGIVAGHEPNLIEGHYSYNGNHTVRIEMWNYTGTPAWDLISDTTITNTSGVLTFFSLAITGTITDYVSGGEVKVRFNHAVSGNINHDFIIDYLAIKDDHGIGTGITDHGSLSGLSDDDHTQYIKDAEFTQDSGVLVGTGAGTFAEETGNTLRTSLGLGTGDSPQFTGIELGHASDTTITRASAGNLNIEGNLVYRAGGTDVPIVDGGTGQSTAQAAIDALSAVSGATNEHVLTKDTATGNAIFKAVAGGGSPGAFTSKCSVYINNTQSIAHNTWTKVLLDTEDYDIDGEFDATGNNRFQPDADGYYSVKCGLSISALGDAVAVYVSIYKNGSAWKTTGQQKGGVATIMLTVSCDMYLLSTDYIELWIVHLHGSNRTIGSATARTTFMDVHKFAGGGFGSRCRVSLTSTQSVPSGAYTKLLLATEQWDNDNEWASNRFTAIAAGYYHVSYQIQIQGLKENGLVVGKIYKNGTGYSSTNWHQGSTVDSSKSCVGSDDVYLNGSTDYIEIFVSHNHGSNRNFLSGTDINYVAIHRFA